MTFSFPFTCNGQNHKVKRNLGNIIMVSCARDCQRCWFNSMAIQRLQFVVSLSKCPVKCLFGRRWWGSTCDHWFALCVEYVYWEVAFAALYIFTAVDWTDVRAISAATTAETKRLHASESFLSWLPTGRMSQLYCNGDVRIVVFAVSFQVNIRKLIKAQSGQKVSPSQ